MHYRHGRERGGRGGSRRPRTRRVAPPPPLKCTFSNNVQFQRRCKPAGEKQHVVYTNSSIAIGLQWVCQLRQCEPLVGVCMRQNAGLPHMGHTNHRRQCALDMQSKKQNHSPLKWCIRSSERRKKMRGLGACEPVPPSPSCPHLHLLHFQSEAPGRTKHRLGLASKPSQHLQTPHLAP